MTVDVKEADSIVSIEILRNTYRINVYEYTKEDIENIIELLQVAKTNRDIKSTEEVEAT